MFSYNIHSRWLLIRCHCISNLGNRWQSERVVSFILLLLKDLCSLCHFLKLLSQRCYLEDWASIICVIVTHHILLRLASYMALIQHSRWERHAGFLVDHLVFQNELWFSLLNFILLWNDSVRGAEIPFFLRGRRLRPFSVHHPLSFILLLLFRNLVVVRV